MRHKGHMLVACTNTPGSMRREQFKKLAEQLTPEQQERLRNKILINKLKSKRVRVSGKRVGMLSVTPIWGSVHVASVGLCKSMSCTCAVFEVTY